MIVTENGSGWEVIYQRAHALLAAQIAWHWRVDQRPQRWVETLAAVAQHDNADREWEYQNQLDEAGEPLSFEDTPLSSEQPREIATNAQYQGRWVALLISRHISELYEPKRGQLDELDHLLEEQQENQRQWQAQLSVSTSDVEEAYALMRWADEMSLLLCQNSLHNGEPQQVDTGPCGTPYTAHMRSSSGDTVVIRPWPFEGEPFQVSVEAQYLSQKQFDSYESFTDSLREAPIELRRWRLIPES